MRFYPKQNGFSIVELMVVIGLFSILGSFAIPSYQNMVENSRIRTATDSILSGLQTARAEAVKRNTSVQFDFVTDSAWIVCISPAAPGSCPTPTPGDLTTIESRAANEGSSANVTIDDNGDSSPYIFNGFGGLISPTTALTIDIGNSALGSSRDLRVVVGTGGATKSCDPALAAGGTDPRRC